VVELDSVPVEFAIATFDSPQPDFGGLHADFVLVRVRAFSLNYRDKAYIIGVAKYGDRGSDVPVGSEFFGEIIGHGKNVLDLSVGTKVMGNGSYPHSAWIGAPPGLPGGGLSAEVLLLHRGKVTEVPAGMSAVVAAAFQVGAQTAFSMVRRLSLRAGAKVLVTGGRSNTTLFAIGALRAIYGDTVEVWVGTSVNSAPLLAQRLPEAIQIPFTARSGQFVGPIVVEQIRTNGGVEAVIDPFFDHHLDSALSMLKPGGVYITCGHSEQTAALAGHPPSRASMRSAKQILTTAVVNNLTLIGNCLGSDQDLHDAIAVFCRGDWPIFVDAVYGPADVGAFVDRTFNAKDRFGKVVMEYDS